MNKKVELNSIRVDRILMTCVVIAFVGVIQFGFSLPVAMRAYPGGTIRTPITKGYLWSENWLSDLGRQKAWNGESNLKSATVFNRSIIVLGMSLAIFFVGSYRGFLEYSFAEFGIAIFGVIAASGLIGVGLTPTDRLHDPHIVCLLVWLTAMLAVAVIFSYQAIQTGFWSGLTISLASFVLVCAIVFYGLSSASSSVMAVQKIVALVSVGWFLLLVCRIGLTAFEVMTGIRGRWAVINRQADDYMKKISKGHRHRR